MNHRQLKTAFYAIAGMIMTCCLGCDDQAPRADLLLELDAEKGFIAFVGAGPNDPVWPILQASAREYIAEGFGLKVRWFTPRADSPQSQADLLKSLRDPDMRGLCIQVSDARVVVPVLEHMRVAGIPIVSMVEPAPEKTRFAHVGLDETAVGRELARGVIEALGPGGGTVMLLHAGYDHPVYGARYLAFMESVRFADQIKVLGEFNCQAEPQEARRIIKEKSERFPRLTAWISICDWALVDGYPADKLFPKGMRYITFGGLPRQWPLVRSGLCPSIVAADYNEVGGRALQFCYSAIRDPAQTKRTAYIPLRRLNLVTLEDYEKDWMKWIQAAPSSASGPATSPTIR